jgi:hypothetical protein
MGTLFFAGAFLIFVFVFVAMIIMIIMIIMIFDVTFQTILAIVICRARVTVLPCGSTGTQCESNHKGEHQIRFHCSLHEKSGHAADHQW